MAIDALTAITPNDGSAYPDNAAINATSPSATDGTPLTAIGMNNYWHGRQQALLNYAGLTPTGVVESDTVSQELEAIQKGFGVIPGRVFRRDTFDDPSVFGDRSLLLTEQGVLIASYVALDAACYVGDANNTAVHTAGGYYYRSSDAGGATPNIAGPYLQLPPNPLPVGLRQYLGDGTDFLVTTSLTETIVRAVAVPYKTIDGAVRLRINFYATVNSASRTGLTWTVPGITFKTGVSRSPAYSVKNPTGAGPFGMSWAVGGSNTVDYTHQSSTTDGYGLAADLEIDSWPTWAKVFDIKHATTY